MDIRKLSAEQLDQLVISLGIAPHKNWQATTNISQARHLFFVVIPYLFPGISLEYHHYPSGHARLILAGRGYLYSEEVNPGCSAALAMVRLSCLAADYLINTTSKKTSQLL